jgi:hypothetical protein
MPTILLIDAYNTATIAFATPTRSSAGAVTPPGPFPPILVPRPAPSPAATGVIVSGPFTILSTPQLNYVDVANLTCPITPRVAQQLWGPEIMLWDDAQVS